MNATKILEDLREVDLFNVDSDYYGSHPHYIKQLENLIHQQADRIAELEKDLTACKHSRKLHVDYGKSLEEERRQQTDRIAELEKHCLDEITKRVYAERSTEVSTELLLEKIDKLEAQTKPLSDEEIKELKQKHIEIELFDEGEYGMEYNIYGVEDFARAIEAKVRGQ